MNQSSRRAMSMLAIVALTIAGAQRAAAQGLEPIAYDIRIPMPGMHEILVQATVPASGRPSLDLMIPTWSPGYYRVVEHAVVGVDVVRGQRALIAEHAVGELDEAFAASKITRRTSTT